MGTAVVSQGQDFVVLV